MLDTKIKIAKKYRFSKLTNERLNKLIELDNWHGIVALIYDYLIIAGAIFIYIKNHYFYPLSMIIIAARQGALSNLLHEAAHSRLARNKRLNYLLGTYFSGYLILQEYDSFINSHIKMHHRYLGDQELDPDYSYHLQAGLYKSQTQSSFIKEFVLKPIVLNNIFSYIKHIFAYRSPTYAKFKWQTIKMYTYLSCLAGILTYFGWLEYFIVLWIIPFITAFPIIGWFIDIAEHYPLVGEQSIDIYMTRNRFSHFLESFIFNIHNENYHLVHHLRPAIPFWNLRKAHAILMEDAVYAKLNSQMGGIFLSCNGEAPVIQSIIAINRKLFKREI